MDKFRGFLHDVISFEPDYILASIKPRLHYYSHIHDSSPLEGVAKGFRSNNIACYFHFAPVGDFRASPGPFILQRDQLFIMFALAREFVGLQVSSCDQ